MSGHGPRYALIPINYVLDETQRLLTNISPLTQWRFKASTRWGMYFAFNERIPHRNFYRDSFERVEGLSSQALQDLGTDTNHHDKGLR